MYIDLDRIDHLTVGLTFMCPTSAGQKDLVSVRPIENGPVYPSICFSPDAVHLVAHASFIFCNLLQYLSLFFCQEYTMNTLMNFPLLI
jgi:hypothetical protein